MKLCLAGPASRKYLTEDYKHCKYMLESFYSIKDWLLPVIKDCELFLLDSGAFTFMNSKKGVEVDFDDYVTKYIEFINKYDIKHFFELDIDSIVGLEEVERIRKRLERETGKKCIPVWHKNRGKEYFIEMCKNYDYVAIGGIASKEITQSEYPYFKWFIDTAHSYGCKIHGLGFTSLKLLRLYNFDSVDSTSWTAGFRFGTLYHFTGRELVTVNVDGRRRILEKSRDLDRHNYYEWIKLQKYVEERY